MQNDAPFHMHVVIIVIWILETIQHNNQDLRDRNHARRTYIRLFVWALTYCCSTIAYKCRTISLSQYTFNQFWKHFYLFSLAHSYMNVFFFVSRPSQSRLQATLFHFCWFPLVLYVLFFRLLAVFISFPFMFICFGFASHCFVFCFGMMCIVECTPAISIRSW